MRHLMRSERNRTKRGHIVQAGGPFCKPKLEGCTLLEGSSRGRLRGLGLRRENEPAVIAHGQVPWYDLRLPNQFDVSRTRLHARRARS